MRPMGPDAGRQGGRKDPVRVAIFTETYDEVNGIANTLRQLVGYCRKRGRDLGIFTHAAEGEDSVEDLGTVKIYRFKPAFPVKVYFDMVFDAKLPRVRIRKAFREGGYNLVHTVGPGSMGLNAMSCAHRHGVPLIGSYHTSLPEYVRDRVNIVAGAFTLNMKRPGRYAESIAWKFMRWFYDQMGVVMAPSFTTASQLEGRLRPPVALFTRGIDTQAFNPRYREDHDGVVVLYVGRVSTEKNLGLLADIFCHRTDARLVVVGDGPYLEEMKKRCPRAGFTGFLKGEDLQKAYASADIFVFPSTTDTFGNVVLEAMSSGLPVVVTDRGGPKELVEHGGNGLIARTPREFRAHLEGLIADPGLRRRMGRRARRYAKSRSWDLIFGSLFNVYEHYRAKA